MVVLILSGVEVGFVYSGAMVQYGAVENKGFQCVKEHRRWIEIKKNNKIKMKKKSHGMKEYQYPFYDSIVIN